jgi:hypothetical protein
MIDPKEKKKKLREKNRKDQEIFNLKRLRDLDAERIEREQESRQVKNPDTGEEKVIWSEKVSTIRNRLTGKKRTSKERWNRFAGTSGGGGRGL